MLRIFMVGSCIIFLTLIISVFSFTGMKNEDYSIDSDLLSENVGYSSAPSSVEEMKELMAKNNVINEYSSKLSR